MDPFLIRAILAAVGLAIVSAPLGCAVVWSRMAYFGEAIAQACLIGVALGLALNVEPTWTVFAVAVAAAFLVLGLSRQKFLPLDSVLGLVHHGTLSLGVLLTVAIAGPSLDLMSYLFGDIYAITNANLVLIFSGGLAILIATYFVWEPLLRLSVNEQLAEAEGVNPMWIRMCFVLLIAVFVAAAIKVVGVLLVIAFLIIPSVAARPFASTPERMVLFTVIAGLLSVGLGIFASLQLDAPGGPAIVVMMAAVAVLAVVFGQLRDNLGAS